MPKPKAVMLITRQMQRKCFAQADLARIAAVTELRPAHVDELSDTWAVDAIAGAEIAITGWGSRPMTLEMLEAAPDLKLVCHSAGSVKWLVNDALVSRGVRVCSAATALGVGVAEFAFGLMLVSMKAGWQYAARTRRGSWDPADCIEWVREPYGAVVGIVGAGSIGRDMIRLCKNLALEAILLYDPYVSAQEAQDLGVEKVELDELMRRSDVVSLHTPATDETRNLINAANLALLKDHAIFINTARGMCVDEAALIAELEKGRIFACLDVTYPDEPPKPGSPLYALPNCILTPHIAGGIKESCHRQGALTADQIEAYIEGRPIPNEYDLATLGRRA